MAKDTAAAARNSKSRGSKDGGSKGGKQDGLSRKEKRAARKAKRSQRNNTIKQAFSMTRKADPRMLPLVLIAFLGILSLGLLLGLLIGAPFISLGFALPIAVLVGMIIFSKRAQKVAFHQVEGELGAAAAVTTNMKGNWRTTPMVGVTRQQDLLHRVLGRPGVILVAEGVPQRTAGLVRAERKRLERLLGDVPIYDVSVGDDEGQVPLSKLTQHINKLPRNIKPATVNEIDRRLKAIGNAGLPIPKGPMPRSARAVSRKMR
jgi:hypothetical protein